MLCFFTGDEALVKYGLSDMKISFIITSLEKERASKRKTAVITDNKIQLIFNDSLIIKID